MIACNVLSAAGLGGVPAFMFRVALLGDSPSSGTVVLWGWGRVQR